MQLNARRVSFRSKDVPDYRELANSYRRAAQGDGPTAQSKVILAPPNKVPAWLKQGSHKFDAPRGSAGPSLSPALTRVMKFCLALVHLTSQLAGFEVQGKDRGEDPVSRTGMPQPVIAQIGHAVGVVRSVALHAIGDRVVHGVVTRRLRISRLRSEHSADHTADDAAGDGRAAIDLYAGRLALSDEEMRLARESDAVAPAASAAPVRLILVGQVNAGKSILVMHCRRVALPPRLAGGINTVQSVMITLFLGSVRFIGQLFRNG